MGPGCQPEGRALLAWAGSSGRPRRDGKKRKELARAGLGPGKREVGRPRAEGTRPLGKEPARGGKEEQAGLVLGGQGRFVLKAGFPIFCFPFSFLLQNYLNSNQI
jgi:hypothetical protein